MANSNEKVSMKEIRETYYKCRDLEITYLWQRSIFLTAFLVLCFTGYGTVVNTFADSCLTINVILLHEIAMGISIIGITFSLIWIMMVKGSKAWYEVYEDAICNM